MKPIANFLGIETLDNRRPHLVESRFIRGDAARLWNADGRRGAQVQEHRASRADSRRVAHAYLIRPTPRIAPDLSQTEQH